MKALVDKISAADHFVLVARLTLLLVVLNTNEDPLVFALCVVATAVLFYEERLLRSPWPWLGLGVVVGASQFVYWWRIDDHLVVTTYWIIAIGLSRLADRRARVMGESARLVVGLVFAFAFGWKLLSSQFVGADFFRYQLVTDDRFRPVAEHVGGTEVDLLDDDLVARDRLYATGYSGGSVTLHEGPRNDEVAVVFTAWGLVIEGAIAAAFLLPLRGRWRHLRAATLFAFAFTTYAVVPVAGFGALLMVLALAHDDTPRLRVAYVGSFALLLAWGGLFPLLV